MRFKRQPDSFKSSRCGEIQRHQAVGICLDRTFCRNSGDALSSSIQKNDQKKSYTNKKLFFINLGGYQVNKFEEQHYTILTVKSDRAAAFNEAKKTLFFKHNHFEGAGPRIDDQYDINVGDIHQ